MFLFLNDFGIDIFLTVTDQDCAAVSVVATTAREFEFRKPDGTLVTKTAVFVTDGSDGRLKYTIESGLLNMVGTWSVRVKLTNGASAVYRGAEVQFSVRN
jgi:uncharacterized protein YfaS (alpha-2-macroglobulin family)